MVGAHDVGNVAAFGPDRYHWRDQTQAKQQHRNACLTIPAINLLKPVRRRDHGRDLKVNRPKNHPQQVPMTPADDTQISSIQNHDLYVGRYGHPLLKGAQHWSFLLMLPSADGSLPTNAMAYQISGSTETYEYKDPEDVTVLAVPNYMGKVRVGTIDATRYRSGELERVLKGVGIKRGDLEWNCQNWIIAALKQLSESTFAVRPFTKGELGNLLAHSLVE